MARRTVDPEIYAKKLRAELEAGLKFITAHYKGKPAARRRAIETLDLLKRHLNGLGVNRSVTRSLDDIHMAFSEAERGRLDPLFAPEPVAHKLPTELSRLHVMKNASIVLDLLIAAKLTRERAAREVAKALRKYKFPIEGKIGVPDWKTVVGWRETLRKTKGHPDVIWYGSIYRLERETLLDLAKAQSLDPKKLAKQQLQVIGQSLTALG